MSKSSNISDISFDFARAAARAWADFGYELRQTRLVAIDQQRIAFQGPKVPAHLKHWLKDRINDCRQRRASFFDLRDGQRFCFIYTGADRRQILGHPENLHLTFYHELGHALDPGIQTSVDYHRTPQRCERLADSFAALCYLRDTGDKDELDIFIQQRDLSHEPYDTGDNLRRAVKAFADENLRHANGRRLFKKAQELSRP